MAKAKRLPSGQYRVLVYSHTENGKRKYVSFTAPTKAEAEAQASKFALNKKRIKHTDLTVGEAIDGYIKAKEAVLSPSTVRVYVILRDHNFTSIQDKRIKSLTSEDIQKFISELSLTESPKTVRNIYGLLRPAISMYAPDISFKVTLPPKQKKRPISPSDDEIRAYLNAATPKMKKRIALAILGLRRGEICAARYEDIHDGILHVHSDWVRDKNNKWVLKELPKTSESDRYVLLPPVLLDMIGEGEGFIVNCMPDTLSRGFERLRDKVGIKYRLHDMRHFFASTAVLLGIPDLYTADMGGWTRGSNSALKSIYQNSMQSMSDYYQSKISDHMGKLIKEDA